MKLFTVTTNSFQTFQILSEKTLDELEYEYKKVVDNGSVSDIKEDTERVYFTHEGHRKILPL